MDRWAKVCEIIDKVLATNKLSTSKTKVLLEKVIDDEEINGLNYPTMANEDLEKRRKKIKLELDRLTVVNTNHKTLLKFIAQKRLEKVAESFKDEKYPVKRAAYLAGFNSPANFVKKFKSIYDRSPKDYLVTKSLTK